MRLLYSLPFAPIQSLFAAVLQTKPVSSHAAGNFCKITSGRALNRPRSPEVRKPLVYFWFFSYKRKARKTSPLQGVPRFCKPRISAPQPHLRTKQIKSFWNFPRFIKPCFSAQKLQLPTAPKLTCSCPFRISLATVSLQYNNPFSKKHQSCVCTTVTLSHRFKAFSPPFCRQNRFRHMPPEIFAKLLPAEL